jgi:hypothetical protein
MRISFAGDQMGFSLRPSPSDHAVAAQPGPKSAFQLHPKWTDLTPSYDPTGRASELDLLQDAGIDVSAFSVALHWQSGTAADARQEYAAALRAKGLPKIEDEDCKTILSVTENCLYVTCFLADDIYDYFLGLCEGFAAWPNPKAYVGRVELPLLFNGVYAMLNPSNFLSFWAGKLPLYSRDWFGFSVYQNWEVPTPPTAEEKQKHDFSQV